MPDVMVETTIMQLTWSLNPQKLNNTLLSGYADFKCCSKSQPFTSQRTFPYLEAATLPQNHPAHITSFNLFIGFVLGLRRSQRI